MKIVLTRACAVSARHWRCCAAAALLTACGGGSSDAGVAKQAVPVSTSATMQSTAADDAGAKSDKVPAGDYDLYVSTTGSDSGSGSEASPFLTITRASRAAKPSTTVHVAPGTYWETVRTAATGNASGRIRFVSDTKWGAKIIGSGKDAMWTNRGDYTDIVGFDVSGSGRGGIVNWASHASISGNHVHDLTVSGGCTDDGGAGIMNADYRAADNDIIGNVVHDVGVPGGCNGIHGIYHANLRGHVFNNIVYRSSAYGIHLWHAANNAVIANNTVFANGSRNMGGGILIGSGDQPGRIVLDDTKVINNIVHDNPRMSIEEYCNSGESCTGPNNIFVNNLVYGNGRGISLRTGSASGTILADPRFVDYRADGSGNYRLQGTSPAIDHGVSDDAPATDIDNVARRLGVAVDVGAYENY